MSVNIKTTNMEITDAIRDYVDKRIGAIDKFVEPGQEYSIYIEIGKTTNHHKRGDHYKAEFDVSINGEKFFTDSEKNDLYKAIDDAKNEVVKKIKNSKKRKETLFKRGSVLIKKMIKGGVSRINPFNSK